MMTGADSIITQGTVNLEEGRSYIPSNLRKKQASLGAIPAKFWISKEHIRRKKK